nr:hypothetical protein [Tanacetum cinerariifolium]
MKMKLLLVGLFDLLERREILVKSRRSMREGDEGGGDTYLATVFCRERKEVVTDKQLVAAMMLLMAQSMEENVFGVSDGGGMLVS